MQVILGLYPPESGDILFDGYRSKIGMDVVRDNVATVLQHPALFNDSVRANLTLGREMDDQSLAGAGDCPAGRNGQRTRPGTGYIGGAQRHPAVGGQQQRLALARMVLSDPKVVILDKPPLRLTPPPRTGCMTLCSVFLKGRTTLIIAHRLSAVKQADRALVFEDGRIVEEGSHDELIRNQGLYASLYGRQEHWLDPQE